MSRLIVCNTKYDFVTRLLHLFRKFVKKSLVFHDGVGTCRSDVGVCGGAVEA